MFFSLCRAKLGLKEIEQMLLKESIPTSLHNYDTLLSLILKAIIELENSSWNSFNATQSYNLRLSVNVLYTTISITMI